MYPTHKQTEALKRYIDQGGDFSIYGNDGIYLELENLICDKYKVKHCLLTNTGTSALSSGFFGLNIQPGDEVIVPVYTFIATVTPLLRLGGIPVFADADPISGQISLDSIKNLVTEKTKAVAITHMWGYPCDTNSIKKFCEENNLKLLEDASHAHFTRTDDKYLGAIGDVGCFSVGARKIVSGGEGGFLITNDDEIYMRAILLGHFVKRAEVEIQSSSDFIKEKYQGLESGFGENYRMHPYAAVMIKELIENEIQNIIDIRYEALSLMNTELEELDKFVAPKIVKGAMFGYKPQLLLNDQEIEELIRKFKDNGMKIKRLDTIPLYGDTIFEKGIFLDKYPGADAYMRGRISIPNFTTENREESIRIAHNYINLFKMLLK
jgi:dTDP-4-amino-4,6-dideoxygalactose transaminase